MPSITTHYMFSKSVLENLNEKEKMRINKSLSIYHLFAQSHDILFYYTFDFKNAKRIRELGHHAHHDNTQNYLINIVKSIKKNNLENNSDALAYLYGSVTHYCLDTTCHPYIFYKTGIYRKENPESIKYKGEHDHMEKDLDAIYYEKFTNKKYNKCNISKEIIGNPKFSNKLKSLITQAYKDTYNHDNIGEFFYKSMINAKIITTLAINDSLGIKRTVYKFIDKITNKRFGYLEAYSTHLLNPDKSYLNLEHKTWNHPSNKEITYNDSFEDLYNKSLENSLYIIRSINKVLFENKDINTLYKTIPDLDYATGVIIENSRRMDYFE